MKTIQLAFIPHATGEAWRIVTLAARSRRTLERVLIVPGAMVLARNVEAPGRTEAQARATALAGLAGDLAAPIGSSACALSPSGKLQRLAFVADKSALEGWIAEASQHSFEPDAIIPDYALLPVLDGARASFVIRGSDALICSTAARFACQRDLLPLMTDGLALVETDLDHAAAQAAMSGALDLLPNLAPLGRGADHKRPSLLPAGIAAAAAVTIGCALPWVDAARLDSAAQTIRQQIKSVAASALGPDTPMSNPLAQLREASLARRQAEAGLNLAADIFDGLGKSPGVEMTRLELTADGALRASLVAPDLSLLQPLRDHLAAVGATATETPGESLPNSIPVDLSIRMSP